MLVWYGVGQSHVGLKLLLALSFAPLLFGAGPIYPLNAPSWSLFDEFVVNAVFGFVAPLLTARRLQIALGAAFFALCVATFFAGSFAAVGGAEATDWPGGILRAAFSFPLGLLLHRWHMAGRLPQPKYPPGWWRRSSSPAFSCRSKRRCMTSRLSVCSIPA